VYHCNRMAVVVNCQWSLDMAGSFARGFLRDCITWCGYFLSAGSSKIILCQTDRHRRTLYHFRPLHEIQHSSVIWQWVREPERKERVGQRQPVTGSQGRLNKRADKIKSMDKRRPATRTIASFDTYQYLYYHSNIKCPKGYGPPGPVLDH
jgi:hypothetical protein